MELYIKFLGNLIDQQYENNHDLLDLFSKLKEKMEESRKCDKEVLRHIQKIKPFLEKYQKMMYFPLLKNTLLDKANMAERYPEIKINFTYPEIFENGKSFVNIDYLENIKKDIKGVLKILSNIKVGCVVGKGIYLKMK